MSEGYRLLDAGAGRRLEQWGAYRLVRPDPEAAGPVSLPLQEWDAADAAFSGPAGKGRWVVRTDLPSSWAVRHGGIRMLVKLAPFKHAGLFPEQAQNWDWMRRMAARAGRPLSILNLFAYTGGATMALAAEGHAVTHVDASKPALAWARENARLNGLPPDAVRWIQDDASIFVGREVRRRRQYDAVVMDPPAVGHAAGATRWDLREHLPLLVGACVRLLSDQPVFFLINAYKRGASPFWLQGLLQAALPGRGRVESGDLDLRTADGRRLSTGAFGRWRPAPEGR